MTAASPPRDPRVDHYIDALPDWQQSICREVRELVHAADPEVAETIKRTVQPYFVLDGNVCALLMSALGRKLRPPRDWMYCARKSNASA